MTNTNLIYKSVIELLDQLAIKHDIHRFPSGAIMVDIWHRNIFYILQFEEEFIGLSEITDENTGFDTTPDEKFYDARKAMERIRTIINAD